MSEPELRLDPAIRMWVFLPIVAITFLVGIIRHYVSVLLSSDKKVDLAKVKDSQLLLRSRSLRENGRYLPKQSFLMRRHYFNNEENGVLKATQSRPSAPPNPMTDPSMMTDMLKGNLTNVLPMIVIGGWINWHFSGFVTTKVPFPLTLRFKPMLQRGIELMSLDASWVSSASWYFLNVFGLRSIYALVLGENNGKKQRILYTIAAIINKAFLISPLSCRPVKNDARANDNAGWWHAARSQGCIQGRVGGLGNHGLQLGIKACRTRNGRHCWTYTREPVPPKRKANVFKVTGIKYRTYGTELD